MGQNVLFIWHRDIGNMGIKYEAEPTSDAAFVKVGMSLEFMLLVLVLW